LIADERSGRKDAAETKLNDNQLSVSVATVRELLDQQLPHWADRPITEGPSAGAGGSVHNLAIDLTALGHADQAASLLAEFGLARRREQAFREPPRCKRPAPRRLASLWLVRVTRSLALLRSLPSTDSVSQPS